MREGQFLLLWVGVISVFFLLFWSAVDAHDVTQVVIHGHQCIVRGDTFTQSISCKWGK